MFPIYNDYGDIIAFSGRQLHHDPNTGKYINSRETILFKKSKVFFALDKARRPMTKEKFALLCEGQIDVIACHENGLACAIATLGTACTPDHSRLLKRFTKEVVLCFDSDAAGLTAADKAFKILVADGLQVRMVEMPAGEDPDTLIKKIGPQAFRELVVNSRDFFEVKLSHETKMRDLTSVRERADLANHLSDLVAYVGDKLTKEALINQISTHLSIGAEEFRSAVVLAEKKHNKSQSYTNRHEAKQEAPQAPTIQPTPMDGAICHLCNYALTSQDAQDWLCEQLESLIDPLSSLEGGTILRNILTKRPDPTKPSAIQAYITTLSNEDQLSLRKVLAIETPEDPIRAAEETTAMVVSTHFQKQEAIIRAKLRQPNLGAEEMMKLLNEAKELQLILKNLQQRFIR